MENGWFIDVFTCGTPFDASQELVTSTLLRQGVPFDIAFSPIGVDGEPVDMVYGLRRASDADIVWNDRPQDVQVGCRSDQLDPKAINLLGIEIEIECINDARMPSRPASRWAP